MPDLWRGRKGVVLSLVTMGECVVVVIETLEWGAIEMIVHRNTINIIFVCVSSLSDLYRVSLYLMFICLFSSQFILLVHKSTGYLIFTG